jgi:tetratricopeptide (TPR) repeat protein
MTKFKKCLVFGAVVLLLTLDRVAISEIPPVIFMDQADSVRNDPVRLETPFHETSHIIRQLLGDMGDPLTTPESRLFQEAMILFDNRQWAMSRNKVQQILNRYSESPYVEKARFLLIDIFQELYADDPGAHYPELTRVFEEVLNRYPDSPYRGGALLGLARLHRNMGNHAEALAYYKLAQTSKSDADALISGWAMLETAKIYQTTGRMNQALLLLENILETNDVPMIRNKTQLEIAQIRYEQNFFTESLKLLEQLVSRDKDVYFQNADVSLYIGNNYFQLGRYDRAGNHLLYHYNAVSGKRGKDMILARVGDAFLQGGKVMDAVRYFQWVVDRYPGSEGAALSWLRLAEQMETDSDDRISMSYSAKQIYENIRDTYQGQSINDSLAQLAILKLAVLYQEEKKYSESLKTLRLFFENNPDPALLENGRFALKNVVEAMIRKAYEEKDYDRVIDLFTQEARSVLPLMDLDSVQLVVARAYRDSGDKVAALDLYQKIAASMPLTDMPDDVLFFTGRALFEASQFDIAKERLSRLINAYPQSPYTGAAMDLMGQILTAEEKYQDAVNMMTRALTHPLSPCDRAGLLVRTGRAALAYQDMEKTLSVLETARQAMDECPALAGYLGDQIGDLYFQAKYFDQAAAVYTHVLNLADLQLEKGFVQYKTALSLWRSGQLDAGRALFETLAAQDDSFWSRLADDHLASASFDNAVR